MLIPLTIGRNSNGELQSIDLAEIPLLMISYCTEENLTTFFPQACSIEYPYKDINYLISTVSRSEYWGIKDDFGMIFLRDNPERGSIISRQAMLKSIITEIRRRETILKKMSKDFKRHFSLNLWNQEKLSYRFVLIDDIWDLVINKPKPLGINLMLIILHGPSVGVHTIFASSISYRNLLQQLVKVNPSITKIMRKKYGIPEPKQIATIGRELIYTPEGLIFYKNDTYTDKFYPI